MIHLKNIDSIDDNLPVYVQVGFNRFHVKSTETHGDHILLHIEEEASNQKQKPIFTPPEKFIA